MYAIELECIVNGLPWRRFTLPECFFSVCSLLCWS